MYYKRTPAPKRASEVQKLMSIPVPTLDIIPRRGCACQEKTYAGLCAALRAICSTIFDICEDLTRSVDISRPAPENSLALFYDNPRKLYLDSRQLALYNIVMKKRKKFDIQEWLKHNEDKHEQWHQHWRVIRFHPLTWLLIMIAIAYGFEL